MPTRIVVYDEPSIRFCEPLPNDWHRSGIELKRQLTEAGFEVFGEHETIADPKADIAIYFDTLMRPQGHPPLHDRSLYMSLEPPVVGNQQRFYDRINGWPYTRILTFARIPGQIYNRKVFWSPYPVVRYERKETDRRGDMVAITANKTSGHPAELYTARREIYRAMGRRLHLYGKGWETDPVRNFVDYRGPCDHIFPVYEQYKYAISIENQWIEGYASEKYWTPLQAGCELIRVGWKPDYTLDDCDEIGWSKRIVGHVLGIIG